MPRRVESVFQDSQEISKAAFQKAKANGHFKDLKPGTLVAFADGKLFATAKTWEDLMLERHRQNLSHDLYVEML